MGRRSIPIVLELEWALVVLLLGLVILLFGHRQQKAGLDIDKIPLIPPQAKTVVGGILLIYGSLNTLAVLIVG